MRWIKVHIERVRSLVEQNTRESLTYAALECRIVVERLCYERLRIAHSYISASDIRRWQPKYVVQTLMQEVDSNIGSSLSLSISKNPINTESREYAQADFEREEYIDVGNQVGFDANKLGRLWQGLSSFLHVAMPNGSNSMVSSYGETGKIRKKVEEALLILEAHEKGNLLIVGIGNQVSFECICGQTNKRLTKQLENNQIVRCINPDCRAEWRALKEETDWSFERVVAEIRCSKCQSENFVPRAELLELEKGAIRVFECVNCSHVNRVRWQLMQIEPLCVQSKSAEMSDGGAISKAVSGTLSASSGQRERSQGWDAKIIAEVASRYYGGFGRMFEKHDWPERGKRMLPSVQRHVVETYGSVARFAELHTPEAT